MLNQKLKEKLRTVTSLKIEFIELFDLFSGFFHLVTDSKFSWQLAANTVNLWATTFDHKAAAQRGGRQWVSDQLQSDSHWLQSLSHR